MKCIVCEEQIWPDEKFWEMRGEAVHHECCDLIEKGLKIREIKCGGKNNFHSNFKKGLFSEEVRMECLS